MKGLYVLIICLVSHSLFGQLRILKDTNDESQGNTQASIDTSIGNYAVFNGRVYFSAYQQLTGQQIWSTDGTETGTRMLPPVFPNSFFTTASFAVLGSSLYISQNSSDSSGLWKLVEDQCLELVSSVGPEDMVTSGTGFIFFSRNDVDYGQELWRTDGTANGAGIVKDIRPGQESSLSFHSHEFLDNILFFVANDGVHGSELWMSDGTAEGTKMVADINPNGNGITESIEFTVINKDLYFNANDGVNGSRIWKTDGTSQGTVMVTTGQTGNLLAGVGNKWLVNQFDNSDGSQLVLLDVATNNYSLFRDVNPGPWQADDINAVAATLDNWIYFILKDANGLQLWRTDGSETNTSLVYSFSIPAGQIVRHMWSYNNKLFLISYPADGASSLLFAGDEDNQFTQIMSRPSSFDRIPLGNKMIMAGSDGVHDYEPWITDGTVDGTHMIKDIEELTSAGTARLASTPDKVIFINEDQSEGMAVWSSDGTEAGTVKLAEGAPPIYRSLYVHGSKAMFSNNDGTHGTEPWITDGTPGGTFMLADVFPGTGGAPLYNGPIWVNDLAYFNNGNGYQIWRTDGTVNGTYQVTEGVKLDRRSVMLNDKVYVATYYDLYRINDVAGSNLELIKTINATTNTSRIAQLKSIAGTNRMFFATDDGVHGIEMWTSDGTAAGTYMIKDIHIANNDSYQITSAVLLNDIAYFFAAETTDYDLWRSDGTDAGTYKLSTVNPEVPNYGTGFKVVGNTVYFTGNDGTHGNELWKTDGTQEGTVMVKDILPGSGNSGILPNYSVAVGNTLYFTATDGVHGIELWSTDGTTAGTKLIKDINKGSQNSYADLGTVVDGRLYFSANDGINGSRLWRSDGTEKGTLLIGGPSLSLPAGYDKSIVGLNHKVYFTGIDASGIEVWVYDPTVQTLTFDPISDKKFGDAPFTVNATSTSTLDIQYSIIDGPATVNGNKVTLTHAGIVTIKALQSGYDGILPASVEQTFTVSKADQTITFNPLGNKIFSDAPFPVTGYSSSSLPVTFSITSGPATISGNTITITGAGTVTVKATQAGNEDFAAAYTDQTFTVAKADQAVAFNTIPNKKSTDPPFNLTATSSSSLPVSFSITSGPATISGNSLTITGAGTVVVKATQPGNDNYNSASKEQTFDIELVLGLEDADDLVTISPNPATTALAVQTTGPFNFISLKDILGRDAISLPITNETTTIEVGHLARGIYVMKMTGTDQSTLTRKVILR